jgi:hypothetical protein
MTDNNVQEQYTMRTTINKVYVEIEQYDGTPNCFLSYKNFSSSLALAQDLGGIEDSDTGELYELKPAVLEKITAWAYANGY